ncbi:hypothetical protein P3T76_011040 [Phytophthora citrophthora]|uniref:Pentacotripeptide-repeat region of PRORP domain-containing protein n=1 Tax=Phytophthora citrophthora TaxID=4793 RepID=A0AAD9LFH3_9STRA|nr:hypothetical protein P3T76_011040 [Phytophthora citrophthora]
MLAEAARRRTPWLRSLAAARRLSRSLQVEATAHPLKEDEGEAATDKRLVHGERRSSGGDSGSLNFHPSSRGDTAIKRMDNITRDRRDQYQRQATDLSTGEFQWLIASKTPAEKDLNRARKSLQKIAKDLADPRKAVERETGFQQFRRQLKAATGKLDRMLAAMRQRKDFAQVEAVAYVYEEVFPQFVGQRKHWTVISEHYAWALNYQKRFQDVVNKFSSCYTSQEDEENSKDGHGLLTPRLAQSIFVALGHQRDATGALQLLATMHNRNIHASKISYFHVLNAMLHDESFTDFECVMEICEEMLQLPGEIVPLSLLPVVMMTAAVCGQSERAMQLYSHPPDMQMSIFTEFRFEICLQQLNHLGQDGMLMHMYHNLMESREASRGLKERVSKYLFRKRLELATVETRNKRLGEACAFLEVMNQHKILASHRAIHPLLRTLLFDASDSNCTGGDEFRVECAEDLHTFFSRFPHSLKWNEFTLCEAIIAGLHTHRTEVVNDLFVFALDKGTAIKYAALEQVVVHYYREGLVKDLARVSDMVQALRLNKHIPLGIAVTEVGMAANLRLSRYKEVVMLFEDFSSLDGERKRVLTRRFMLKTVLSAYKHLGRTDEAMAIQELLHQNYWTRLDEHEEIDEEETEDERELDEESADEIQLPAVDDNDSDEVGEQERTALERFKR